MKTAPLVAMSIAVGAIIGAYTIHQITPEPTTEYQVEVYERVVYTDLDNLRQDFAETAEQLRQECLYIIERNTGDPMPGIIHHIDRHYQGDACAAADEVLNGGW